MKSSKARSLRRATSSSPRSMCRRMSNASLLLAPSCAFRSGGNAWHTVSNAAPIIFRAWGSYTYLTSLNEGISSSLFAPMQARPALPLRAGRKKRRSVSPTVQEVCEDCKSGRARKSQPRNRVPEMKPPGGGSGVPRSRTFCGGQARARAGRLRPKHLAIFVRGWRRSARLTTAVRSASAISALRPIATKLVRRDELTQRADRLLAIRPRRRSPLAA